ncbi:MAG: ASCH domain-containing protein [Planctomycetes bacterium]|nr:ASCH domain-containing protein [Planctomycetota bacterium]
MDEYPERTCTLDALVTHARLVTAVLEGRKTQQRRNGVYGYPGEVFELEGRRFRLTDLRRERLGQMSDADARAEGYPSLAAYRDLILRMHAGMTWDDAALVWVHEFEPAAE